MPIDIIELSVESYCAQKHRNLVVVVLLKETPQTCDRYIIHIETKH